MPTRYPQALVILHWLMAVLFIGMLASGLAWQQGLVPNVYKAAFIGWHKAMGVSLLLLIVLRLAVRAWAQSTGQIPAFPKGLKPTQAKLAKLGHLALYAGMVAMPLSGWWMVSSSPKGWPTVLWGSGESAVIWPHMPFTEALKPTLYPLLKEIHEYGGFILLALVVVHIAAVLKHRYADGINLLPRMR